MILYIKLIIKLGKLEKDKYKPILIVENIMEQISTTQYAHNFAFYPNSLSFA